MHLLHLLADEIRSYGVGQQWLLGWGVGESGGWKREESVATVGEELELSLAEVRDGRERRSPAPPGGGAVGAAARASPPLGSGEENSKYSKTTRN